MVDCRIRKSSDGDTSKYDVRADLLKVLNRDGGIPFTDIFILTHGDQDHCQGFENSFYAGDPKKYSDSDRKEEKIRIDVLWFSPMALEESGNDDAACFKKEARRRIKLHNDNGPDKNLPGNRIVIIGYNLRAFQNCISEISEADLLQIIGLEHIALIKRLVIPFQY